MQNTWLYILIGYLLGSQDTDIELSEKEYKVVSILLMLFALIALIFAIIMLIWIFIIAL